MFTYQDEPHLRAITALHHLIGGKKVELKNPGMIWPGWAKLPERKVLRAEVLLPRDVDDRFADPRTLMEAIDAAAPGPKPLLLTYVTITFDTPRLHEQYELVRGYALAHLVHGLGNAVLAVQHAPHLAGFDTPPHVHLLARKVTSLGIAPPLAVLSSDKGRSLVVDAFTAFRAAYEK